MAPKYQRVDQDQLVVGKEQGGWVFGVQFIEMVDDQIKFQGSDDDIARFKKVIHDTNHLTVKRKHDGGPWELFLVHRNEGHVGLQQVLPDDFLVLDPDSPEDGKPTIVPERIGILVLKHRSAHHRRGTC